MALDKTQLSELRDLKKVPDSDDIRCKQIIKEKLLNNEKLIYAINNLELQKLNSPADEYYGINIFPYYIINPTQTNSQNFVCYEVSFNEVLKGNSVIKIMQIIFYILCEQKNVIDTKTAIARHDLIAAILLDEFNWTNYFGSQIHCISNKPSVVDTNYACRTLIFEAETPVNIVQTKDKISRIVNAYGKNRI